jgi:Xaa-Pro aminopeptidase
MPRIEKPEFEDRVKRAQVEMERMRLDGLLVYGDEYRKENLRYFSNFWPIFERAVVLIPRTGRPVLASAPEGEKYAAEMAVWENVHNVKEFMCVSVPDSIDYPLAKFSALGDLVRDALGGGRRLGLVGWYDIPAFILERIRAMVPGAEIVDAGPLAQRLRLVKSPAEIACLREAGRLACIGYQALMKQAVPGATELAAAGAAEGAARAAGAEAVIFTVMGTGPRCATIIGRPVERVIRDGDMVMAALAVQYQGYVATAEYPFVAGKMSDGQKRFLAALFEAANVQLKHLKTGTVMGEMVRAVRDVFRRHKLDRYDVYPPMHGIGLAEAESPYPDEKSEARFESGTCVNSDISLFGHPDGSNRIEEGFLITPSGPESLTPLIRKLVAEGV